MNILFLQKWLKEQNEFISVDIWVGKSANIDKKSISKFVTSVSNDSSHEELNKCAVLEMVVLLLI